MFPEAMVQIFNYINNQRKHEWCNLIKSSASNEHWPESFLNLYLREEVHSRFVSLSDDSWSNLKKEEKHTKIMIISGGFFICFIENQSKE